jgi:hypothetical protein
MAIRGRPVTDSAESSLEFEALLTDLSSRFIGLPPGDVDSEIEDAQRGVCEVLGVDLSALWEGTAAAAPSPILTHMYSSQPELLPSMGGMSAREYFPWLEQEMLAGYDVVACSFDDLPGAAAFDRDNLYPTVPLSAGGKPLVGVSDVKEHLLKGMEFGDRTFKVHLDGYITMDSLAAGKGPYPRHEFRFFNDDGSLAAPRYDQRKIVFAEQRAEGFAIWGEGAQGTPDLGHGCRRGSVPPPPADGTARGRCSCVTYERSVPMKSRLVLILTLSALLLAALASQAQAPPAQSAEPQAPPAQPQAQAPAQPPAAEQAPAMGVAPTGKTRIEGTIANTGGTIYLGGFFTIEIDRWTTPEEAAELKKILVTSGQKALLEKVWDAKQIGFLKIGSSMGKALFFARAIPVPGGLIVRALTNSSLGRGHGRAGDYPFGYIEMIIPNEGEGYGTIVGMAKISFAADGTVQIEGYGNLPEKLMAVKIEKKKE